MFLFRLKSATVVHLTAYLDVFIALKTIRNAGVQFPIHAGHTTWTENCPGQTVLSLVSSLMCNMSSWCYS